LPCMHVHDDEITLRNTLRNAIMLYKQ
jgi:hypothetical protein